MSALLIHREALPGASSAGAVQTAVSGSGGGAGARVLLRLVGDADLAHAVDLAGALDQLRHESPSLVVIDLSAMDFISSMGIGKLFSFARALQKQGGEARLAAPNVHVAEALARCRAEQMMKVFPTVAAASA